jgi:hypothetical protein
MAGPRISRPHINGFLAALQPLTDQRVVVVRVAKGAEMLQNTSYCYETAEQIAGYIRDQYRTGNLPWEISDAALFRVMHMAELMHLDRYHYSLFYERQGAPDGMPHEPLDMLSQVNIDIIDAAIQRLGGIG